MSPTIIYRVENEGGNGPWSSSRVGFLEAGDVLPSTWHAFPSHDIRPWEYHGFNEPACLQLFTKADRVKLRQHGYRQRTYMVPPGTVRYGTLQVLFQPDLAVKIEDRLMPVKYKALTIRTHRVVG